MGMTTSNTNRDNYAHLKNRPKNRADIGSMFNTPEVTDTVSPAPGTNGTRKHAHPTDSSISDTEPINDTTETGNPTDDDSKGKFQHAHPGNRAGRKRTFFRAE
jgi:hypothetical protein